MRDRLAHRGPDDAGLYLSPDRRIGLGFRRLAIVDLSPASNQPLCSADGRFAIVFNGEIVNYRALRQELRSAGWRFNSEGDAEVALYAYAQYGAACLERFHGMFAFAVWDDRDKTLFLARDRFGIKPLYYFADGRRLLFASELKALLEHRAVSRRVDPAGFVDYLTYGYVPGERAIVCGVKKLPPAHWLRADADGCEIRRYWRLEYAPADRSDRSVYDELRARLEAAVDLWMVSDVEIGAFLSGGLDSSSVCRSAARRTSAPLRTFSIGFDDPRQDETGYARLAAEAVGTRHAERRVTLDDARASLGLLSRVYDEPMVDTSCVPTLSVAAFASESVKVALSGDGADELFFGYGWYRQLIAAQQGRRASALDPVARWLIRWSRGAPGLARITTLERFTTPDVVRQYFLLRGFFDPWEKQQLLGPSQYRTGDDDLGHLRRHFDPSLPLEASLRLLDIHTYLADDILPKVDRASMAYSLEVRPPLLEHTLAEFAMTIPERLVYGGRQLKHTLKHAMHDALPAAIIQRGKRGFSAPIVAWLRGGFAAEAETRISAGAAAADGLIDPRYVRRMIANYTKGRWYKLWQLLVFEEWYRRWIRRAGDLDDAGSPYRVTASLAS